jgi:G3E family GTPase
MNVILIGGFLGSGKTTVIRHLAEYLVVQLQKQVVIIENEAGEVGIDDQFLALEGFRVKEIMGGCVCCQLTGELTLAVNKIEAEYHPHWLLIETTGIAKPATVTDVLKKYGEGIDRIFTLIIVDAGRWFELMEIMPGLITSQVAEADLVLVNKVDEADGDALRQLIAEVRKINPGAAVKTGSALKGLDLSMLKELHAYAAGSGETVQA